MRNDVMREAVRFMLEHDKETGYEAIMAHEPSEVANATLIPDTYVIGDEDVTLAIQAFYGYGHSELAERLTKDPLARRDMHRALTAFLAALRARGEG